MIMRVLLAAIIAGMLAGAIASAFQIWRVTPLILAAGFAANTLAMMALFWIVLGVAMGWSPSRARHRAES